MTPRPNKLTSFSSFPEIPSGYPLLPCWSIIVPVFRDVTNLINNPSFEYDTNNWTALGGASLSASTTRQFVGARSCQITMPNSGVGSIAYGSTTALSLTSGTTYIASIRLLAEKGGLGYSFYVGSSPSSTRVSGSGIDFISTGMWQYIWFPYKESSTTSRMLVVASNGRGSITLPTSPLVYVDAVQFEAVPSNELAYPTTYIDGDQQGLTIGEFPLPYYWTGSPHASTSVRGSLTRSGGRVVNFRDLGVALNASTGLGLVTPQHASLPYGQLDGEIYQRTQKGARVFSLAGRITGRSASLMESLVSSFSKELDSDSSPRREPLVLKYQPMDEEEIPNGEELTITATYEGGLEGSRDNLNSDIFVASFKQRDPIARGHDDGATLTVNQTITNANAVIKKLPSGLWSSLSTGMSGGGITRVFCFAEHPDGTIYIGGDFTDAGGSGADFAAKYNPVTNTFSVIKAATSFNAIVNTILVHPNGLVYFGGSFTNVDGIANADGIVAYNPTTDSFSALGTGVAAGGIVRTLKADSAGRIYAGGTFTLMGGVANTVRIAYWDGSVWNAMGTGANNPVNIIVVRGTNVYAGGEFTLMGGVANTVRLARWDGTVWNAMSTGANGTVEDMDFGLDGYLYIVGGFSTLGGLTINFVGRWNGVSYLTVGTNNPFPAGAPNCLLVSPSGVIYIGGNMSSVGGITLSDGIVAWDGSSYTPVDVDLPGTALVSVIFIDRSGSLYLGYDQTGSAITSAINSVINNGTSRAYPILIIKGPSSGSSRIYQISIPTTGKSLYMDYTILSGEIATLTFDPNNLSFISNFQGDISNKFISSSNESDFFLTRGNNSISVMAAGSPTMQIYWHRGYNSFSDAVGKV